MMYPPGVQSLYQPKPMPHSKIPPRGFRQHRQPINVQPTTTIEDNFNSPNLNEMMTFKPIILKTEQQKRAQLTKTKELTIQKHHDEADEFFKSIVDPYYSVTLPEPPTIEQCPPVIIHRDSFVLIEGSCFSVTNLDEAPEMPQDVDPFILTN